MDDSTGKSDCLHRLNELGHCVRCGDRPKDKEAKPMADACPSCGRPKARTLEECDNPNLCWKTPEYCARYERICAFEAVVEAADEMRDALGGCHVAPGNRFEPALHRFDAAREKLRKATDG